MQDKPEKIVSLKGSASAGKITASHGMATAVKELKPPPRPQTGHEVMKKLTADLPKIALPLGHQQVTRSSKPKAHVFDIGGKIVIGDSVFEIRAIGKKTMKLRLVGSVS